MSFKTASAYAATFLPFFIGVIHLWVLTVVEAGHEVVCEDFTSCAACTEARHGSVVRSSREVGNYVDTWPFPTRPRCGWCTLTNLCTQLDNHPPDFCWDEKLNTSAFLTFEYDCPLGPVPYPPHAPDFLPNWMGNFREAGLFTNATLLDLTLPGTHDSLTYDLSLTISEDGIDNYHEIADWLHRLSGGTLHLLPGELEDFFRMQAKTQQLTLTQQLDNGIRFIDFRLMLDPQRGRWYSMHFMQSNREVEEYWQEIRSWIVEHPSEIVLLWLSRHGNPTARQDDQYPAVSRDQKKAIWKNYTDILNGLLCDGRYSTWNRDTVEDLLERGCRLITFASDYIEFTDSSPFAIDAARIQNCYDNDEGAFDEATTFQKHLTYFHNASRNNKAVDANDGFTLLGMNTQGKSWQISAAAEHRFLGWRTDVFRTCSSQFEMPTSPHWCPANLLDIAQLASYYNQLAFEYVFEHQMGAEGNLTAFPHALYLDALDFDGTLRTGTELLYGADRGGQTANKLAKFSYVDTILSFNARRLCHDHVDQEACKSLIDVLADRRALHPVQTWNEPSFGRFQLWPRLVPYSEQYITML